ncbi:MAG: hypothetical protein VX951_12000 [Planctomycetota bacterium]|nr:hypothetical protein [Planctomycetota bacterium]
MSNREKRITVMDGYRFCLGVILCQVVLALLVVVAGFALGFLPAIASFLASVAK